MAVAFKTSLGSNFNNVSGTAYAIVTTAAIAVGDFIVVRWASDNLSATTPTCTVTDSVGNTYVNQRQGAVNATAAAGVAGGIATCKATIAMASGQSIILTWSAAISGKAWYAESFTGVENTVRVTSSSSTGTATAATSTALGAGTVPAGDLLLGTIANETRATITGATTSGVGTWSTKVQVNGGGTSGQDATSVAVAGQYVITTGSASGALYTPTAVASEWWCSIVAMQASPAGAITQAAYQFFDDAGDEATAPALAAQNTAVTGDIGNGDGYGVVRVRLQSTDSNTLFKDDDFTLQWEKNGNGTWTDVSTDPLLYDGVAVRSWSGESALPISTLPAYAWQSFLGNGQKLSRISAFLKRIGTGGAQTYTASLFAHTGSYGTGNGTGAALATSITSIAGTAFPPQGVQGWIDFAFNESFTLVNGTPYVAAIIATGGTVDAANTVNIVYSGTPNAVHPGSGGDFYAGAWHGYSGVYDYALRLFTKAVTPPTTVIGYANPNLSEEASLTGARLTGGSGTYTDGAISEYGRFIDFNGRSTWTNNNYTEMLFSVKLLAANLANGDTLRFRVVRNGSTTGVTYTVTPTINVIGIPPAPGGKMKVWSGSAWVDKPVKVYNGSAWVEKPVKVWSGSAWVLS